MYQSENFNDRRPNVGVTVALFKYDEGDIKIKTYKRAEDAEVYY